ncbi:hypothetical protein [Parasitella parasitica]|uniref:FAR1 domain-containing protein n=1 Tax=Parasitella parasitica TaxID=35722 RepID=A0A0B7MU75_9FUNG|nr:hypothetical protein [Parasitella parasitica]
MTEELSFIRDSLTQMLEDESQNDENIKVMQKFDSMKDIRQAAIRYARRHKFAVSTLRSGERQLVMVCKHSGAYRATKTKAGASRNDTSNISAQVHNDIQPSSATQEPAAVDQSTTAKKGTRKKLSQKIHCPFEIRAKPLESQWVIYKIVYEHNHEMAADIKAYAQHRKLSPETKQFIIDLMNSGSTNSTILECLRMKGIDNVLKKDLANIRQAHFNGKSKKGKQAKKPQKFLHVKVAEDQSLAVGTASQQAPVQHPQEESKPSPACSHASPKTESIEQMSSPGSIQTAEGQQLYQFISQNNVQVN